MSVFGRLIFLIISATFVILAILPFVESSPEPEKPVGSHKSNKHIVHKLSPQLSFQITLHGFFLWASIGFLMPVGILIIRMSNREECGKRLKVLFYSHVILQLASVLLATAGAVMSIKNFDNSFNNTHQRIGLALYAIIWLQPLIGFCRPQRGSKRRSIWYFVHWILGTGVSILGIINIYTGLHAYHTKTSKSVRLWSILFSAEISLIAFLYLFQDRWEYMQKQGVILGDEQIKPTEQISSPRNSQKELTMP
ncbi:cytochrome b561 domain-containing protein At2g30890-like [Tasmannia lanceolata]|uniref:cytochrome b561 domain-containing protein At2g30890-like n=1 Tax=Tasmannia lanceolata TaxID=3420 RepID=UPI004064971F